MIDVALKNLKETLAGTDIDAIKHAHELLLAASNDFTRRLYQNVQAQQSAAGGASGDDAQTSDDEVADAEMVDDEKQRRLRRAAEIWLSLITVGELMAGFSEGSRKIILSVSNSRNWSVSTFRLASGTWRRNCPNRSVPSFKAFTIIGFHLPSITSIVALTGHAASRISNSRYKIVPTGLPMPL